jgi:hypothetical protein
MAAGVGRQLEQFPEHILFPCSARDDRRDTETGISILCSTRSWMSLGRLPIVRYRLLESP